MNYNKKTIMDVDLAGKKILLRSEFNVPHDKTTGEITSANYLATLLLRTAGLETTPYMDFLWDLSKQVEAINLNGYRDAEGNEYSYEDDSPYADLIEEYRTLQYNYLFDADGRIDQIFTLGDQAEE